MNRCEISKRSRRVLTVMAMLVALTVFLAIFYGGYKYGQYQCKPCPQLVQKEVVKKPAVAKKKPSKKVAQAPAPIPASALVPTSVPAPAPVPKSVKEPAPPSVPAPTPAPVLAPAPAPVLPPVIPVAAPEVQRLALRLNVVEWSPLFDGKCLESRQIGSAIRAGLAAGTVKRSVAPVTFSVNGVTVTVQGGQAILDPGPIGPETAISVRPLGAEKFVLPPGAQFPLVVGPEEMDFLVKKGVKEIWLNFLLAPR